MKKIVRILLLVLTFSILCLTVISPVYGSTKKYDVMSAATTVATSPTAPIHTPTPKPTSFPTVVPTQKPAIAPTIVPTVMPTQTPLVIWHQLL